MNNVVITFIGGHYLAYHSDFSLSCIGEGNGNPLQCSCLENLRDGGAWWAAVYGVTHSRTQLKRLSSSSSRRRRTYENNNNSNSVGKDVEKSAPLYSTGRYVK